jgi:hypothetical protein
VKLVQFDRNEGFSRGNNKAIQHCEGEFLVFLNQDTIVHRDWLQTLLGAAMENPEYAVLQSNILMPRNGEFEPKDRHNYPTKVHYYNLTKYGHVAQKVEGVAGSVIESDFVSGCSLLIRKSKVEAIGYLFDESLGTYGEDLELSLRLTGRGERLGTVSRSVVYHIGSFAFSLSKYSLWKNVVMIRNRILAFWKNTSPMAFIGKLPWLLCSQPVKIYTRAQELRLRPVKTWAIVLLSFPLVAAGLFAATGIVLREWMGGKDRYLDSLLNGLGRKSA